MRNKYVLKDVDSEEIYEEGEWTEDEAEALNTILDEDDDNCRWVKK